MIKIPMPEHMPGFRNVRAYKYDVGLGTRDPRIILEYTREWESNGDLGLGSAVCITCMASEDACIYYMRAESYGYQLRQKDKDIENLRKVLDNLWTLKGAITNLRIQLGNQYRKWIR